MLTNKIAQTLNEYAVVIVLMTTAFVGIQMYFKRGIQGVVKLAADDLGNASESVYGVQSQTLGVMEQGLVDYSVEDPIATQGQKKSTLVQVHQDDPNPMRTYTTEYDTNSVAGTWNVTYKVGPSESFGAKEKTQKGNANNAVKK